MLRRFLCCLLGHSLVVERRVPDTAFPVFVAWCASCRQLCVVLPVGPVESLGELRAFSLHGKWRTDFDKVFPQARDVVERVERLGKAGETDG